MSATRQEEKQALKFNPLIVGTIVRLRSGGPRMTVKKLGDRDLVECCWFVDGEIKWGMFPPATIRRIREGK